MLQFTRELAYQPFQRSAREETYRTKRRCMQSNLVTFPQKTRRIYNQDRLTPRNFSTPLLELRACVIEHVKMAIGFALGFFAVED